MEVLETMRSDFTVLEEKYSCVQASEGRRDFWPRFTLTTPSASSRNSEQTKPESQSLLTKVTSLTEL